MKQLALMIAFIMIALNTASANNDMFRNMELFSIQAEEKFELLDNLNQKNNSTTYSIAKISIGYGKLDVGAGSGRIEVDTTTAGKLLKIRVKADVGMLGINSTIIESISLADLKAGKTLEFSMDGAGDAVMKITADKNFSDFGGKITMKINTTDGWKTESGEILRGQTSGKYAVWQGNDKISSVDVNMRGYSISKMKVGWYELVK